MPRKSSDEEKNKAESKPAEDKKTPASATSDKVVPKEEPKAAPKEAAPPPEPRMSFARWFRSKGFKPHWASGMEAYADTSGRRTAADWEALFKNY